MKEKNTIVAICYDFDKTLSPKNMQEYTLFPLFDIEACDFWKESNNNAKTEKMDKILSYMQLIIKKAQYKDIPLTKGYFNKMGEEIELFAGVDTWFDRINKYGKNIGVEVEHYIISSGLKEIIEGTSISNYVKEIYASSYLYNAYEIPIWPKQVVNHTQKTQCLFRISKNCLDLSNEEDVNKDISDNQKRIPFTNIIYIGDSDTDIPAMKLVKDKGGISIGVYSEDYQDLDKIYELIKDNRINFSAPAIYKEDGILDYYIKNALKKIKKAHELSQINKKLEIMNH